MDKRALYDSFYNGINRKNTECCKYDREDYQKEVYEFGIADSDYPTCDEVIYALKKRAEHGAFGYAFLTDCYFNAINKWFSSVHNYEVSKDEIVPVTGVIFALYFIVNNLLNKGDKVVISTPVYNHFPEVVLDNGCVVLENKLVEKDDSYEIDFIDLENKIKEARMYILCSPHNPVGRVWTREEVEKVVNICKKYNCILVSDEIHCDLILGDNVFTSTYLFTNIYDKILVCTSPSKTFNLAGMKNALIFTKNKEYKKLLQKKIDQMDIYPNQFAITALVSAYNYGYEWMMVQREYLYDNYIIAKEIFEKRLPRAKVYKLEGTYLLWINLRYLNNDDIASTLIKHNVRVNSGTIYSSDYQGYIRINLATTRKNLVEGVNKIIDIVLERI